MLLGELIDFVAPGFRTQYAARCPPWPPDVFAVTGTLLRRTGAYVRAVELAKARPLLRDGWPARAERLAAQWRASFTVRGLYGADRAMV